MQQLDLFDTIQQPEQILNQEIPSFQEKFSGLQEGIKNKTSQLMPQTYNFIFTKGRISSYKIEIEGGKIKKVFFSYGKEKFQLFFSYNYCIKNIKHYNYSETDPDEREKMLQTFHIKEINHIKIRKKVASGYSEFKESINYFKFLGLDHYSVLIFLEELLKKFHHQG